MALQQIEQVRGIKLRVALQTFDEVAQQQVFLTTDRVDAHHGMLGLVHGRGEDPAIALLLLLGDIRLGRRVVILIAVYRPELVGQRLQLGRQVQVRRRGVGPYGVATRLGGHHRTQDRGLGIGIHEGHIGVPGVGPAPFAAIQFQQVASAFAHRHRGVGNRFAEQVGKGFLPLVIKVMLGTKEDHLVLHQRGLDGLDHRWFKVGAQLHPTDLGTDASGDRVDVQRMADGCYGACGIAHGMTLIWLLCEKCR